jgi:hypothetical protein
MYRDDGGPCDVADRTAPVKSAAAVEGPDTERGAMNEGRKQKWKQRTAIFWPITEARSEREAADIEDGTVRTQVSTAGLAEWVGRKHWLRPIDTNPFLCSQQWIFLRRCRSSAVLFRPFILFLLTKRKEEKVGRRRGAARSISTRNINNKGDRRSSCIEVVAGPQVAAG